MNNIKGLIISWTLLIIAFIIGSYLKTDPFGKREGIEEKEEEKELILLLKSYSQEDTVMTRKTLAEKLIWKLERD